MTPPKTALVHDWLNGMRGGEKCLEVFCELYPDSPIHTLFYEKGRVSSLIAGHSIHSSWVKNLPGIHRYYRYYLPFYARAVESFDLSGFDLIVSTSHCVAKGARKSAGAKHFSYCFTPMRYAWGFFEEYFGGRGAFSRKIIGRFLKRMREWDLETNRDVDHFAAISNHVKNRIAEYYKREAEVIYPPVDTDFFTPACRNALRRAGTPTDDAKRGDAYLIVSALVPYKRIDLAIQVFNKMKRPLRVIGEGPEMRRLKKLAHGDIQFLGWQSNESIREHYRSARALIFPGEEDFGIVPVEAQACGSFVIAYGKGGALETVYENKTGVFFEESVEMSLADAVERFERLSFNPDDARANAIRFNRARFKAEIQNSINRLLGCSEETVSR